MLTNNRNSSPFQHFFGKGMKSIVPILARKFGEMVVMYQNSKMAAKMKDRGTTCIWLGYAADHTAGTHRVFNPKTNQVILMRDVRFLKQTYGEYQKSKDEEEAEHEKSNTPMKIEDDDSDNIESTQDLIKHNIVSDDDSSDEEHKEEEDLFESNGDYHKAEQSTINPKVLRELKKLDTSYNPVLDDIYKTGRENSDNNSTATVVNKTARCLTDIGKVVNDKKDDSTSNKQQFEEPNTFQEAWHHPDEHQQKKWHEAIRKEFHFMQDW